MDNPNKHIRKYFFDTLHRQEVQGVSLFCFDTRQATSNVNACYLMLDQNNDREDETKCNISTTQNFTIEVIQRVNRSGNSGSRVFLDDATEYVYQAFDNINITGYFITQKSISDNSIITYDSNEIINRNIITLTFKLSENGTN